MVGNDNLARADSSLDPSRRVRVLLVDDNPGVLDVSSELIASASDGGFATTATTDQSDALEIVESGDVDCVVSDYEMPEMDGIELLHRVQAIDPDLPFVLFTGRGSEEIASRAIAEGVTDYLQKDFSLDQFEVLVNRIENAVRQYRTEQERERREDLLSDIANNLSEAVFVAGADDDLLYIGDVIEDVYGIPKAEIEEDPYAFLERVHPEDRPGVEAWIDGMKADDDSGDWAERYEIEYRFDHPEEGWRWIRTSVDPILDDGGECARMVGTTADVTERREAIADLERSEETFRSIAEMSNDAIFRVDTEGVVTYASPALEDILGYDPETVEGEDFVGFVDEDDRDVALAAFLDVLDGEARNGIEIDLEHTDGRPIPIEVNSSPLREDGEIVGVQGVARDVTDRKAREREFEQYETILETVPDGVFVLDEEGRILVSNDRAARMVGTEDREDDGPSEPVPEMGEEGIASDEAVERYTTAVRELLAGERDRTMYRLPTTVDGERRVLEIHLALRPTDGEFRGTVGVIRDITQRVQYERELERQNDRLQQFMNTVSHDLRNPLNVAMGQIDLAREECDSPHLETAAAHHERMNALIDDLLALARQGQSVVDPAPTDLGDVAERAWNTVETGDAELVVQAGLGEVWADESRVRQLFENLFRNSVEHGSTCSRTESDDSVEHGSTSPRSQVHDDAVEHGVRRVSALDRVSVTVGPLSDDPGFFVSDDGPGIPPSERERGHSTAGSTGFGLPIVEEIAGAHDWSISLTESEAGGARFELRFGSPHLDGGRTREEPPGL